MPEGGTGTVVRILRGTILRAEDDLYRETLTCTVDRTRRGATDPAPFFPIDATSEDEAGDPLFEIFCDSRAFAFIRALLSLLPFLRFFALVIVPLAPGGVPPSVPGRLFLELDVSRGFGV